MVARCAHADAGGFRLWPIFSGAALRRKVLEVLTCGGGGDGGGGGGGSCRGRTAYRSPQRMPRPRPRSDRLAELLRVEEPSECGDEAEAGADAADAAARKVEAFEELKAVVGALQDGGGDGCMSRVEAAKAVRRKAKDDAGAREMLAMLGAIPPLVAMLDEGGGGDGGEDVTTAALYALLNLGIGNDTAVCQEQGGDRASRRRAQDAPHCGGRRVRRAHGGRGRQLPLPQRARRQQARHRRVRRRALPRARVPGRVLHRAGAPRRAARAPEPLHRARQRAAPAGGRARAGAGGGRGGRTRHGPRARRALQPRGGLPRGPPRGEPRPRRGAVPRRRAQLGRRARVPGEGGLRADGPGAPELRRPRGHGRGRRLVRAPGAHARGHGARAEARVQDPGDPPRRQGETGRGRRLGRRGDGVGAAGAQVLRGGVGGRGLRRRRHERGEARRAAAGSAEPAEQHAAHRPARAAAAGLRSSVDGEPQGAHCLLHLQEPAVLGDHAKPPQKQRPENHSSEEARRVMRRRLCCPLRCIPLLHASETGNLWVLEAG